MEILVAVKPVPEAETRLRPNASGTAIDPDGVKFVLAGYDESAVEQALLLKEAHPETKVRAITFGPAPRSEEVLRACLALGCDSATWVEAPPAGVSDTILAARAVAASIASPPDLVLCGRQSGDGESGTFPGALGAVLRVPSLGNALDVRWSPDHRGLALQRSVEGGTESVAATFPCVLGLQQAWNDPRTAKLPNILKSRKAAIERVPWASTQAKLGELGSPRSTPSSFRLPPPRTGAKMISYDGPEDAARKLVELLRSEAKVLP